MDLKQLNAEIGNLQSLGDIADAFAQISSTRMKKTRESVLLSRSFLEALNVIFPLDTEAESVNLTAPLNK